MSVFERGIIRALGAFVRWGLKGFQGNFSDMMKSEDREKNFFLALGLITIFIFMISYCGARK